MSPGRPRFPLDDSFDVDLADRLAHFETFNKHHYRPNTYLHKWWGRRCGSTFRLILKGLVADPSRQGYYKPGGLEGTLIYDPMMGGGTTLHEAIRLGANVAGGDVDPIPVLQARASLSAISLPSLERAFLELFHCLRDEFSWLFVTACPTCERSTELWHVLYGLRRRCACGEAVVVDALALRHDTQGRSWSLCPTCDDVIVTPGDHVHACPRGLRLVEKHVETCAICGQAYTDIFDRPYAQRYEPLVVVGECPTHGLFYKPLDAADHTLLGRANGARSSLTLPREGFAVEAGDKSIQLIRRGIENYLDLFSSRQLMVMARAIELLPSDDPAVRLNLALLLSTSMEFNSLLCGYKGVTKRRAGAVRHAFSHHAYSFPYTALETNPLYANRASGTLMKLFYGRLERGRRWAVQPRERLSGDPRPRFTAIAGERDEGIEVTDPGLLTAGTQRFYLRQGSSVTTPLAAGSVDAVVTDPPYYDSIQYTDLAAYFRVWLRRMVPDAADWDYDAADSAVDPERRGQESRYAELLAGIFQECRRVLRPEGRLVFTFHHWKPEAWTALTWALYRGGFGLVNRYVVHAEHPISVHINNMRALTHDAILVCAPREVVTTNWAQPSGLMGLHSRDFSQGCADALGWMLGQPGLDEEEVARYWYALLAG